MKPEPLKGKIYHDNAWDIGFGEFEEKDIKSACEWLKKESIHKSNDFGDLDSVLGFFVATLGITITKLAYSKDS